MKLSEWMKWKKDEMTERPTPGELAVKLILNDLKVKYIQQKVNTRKGVKRIYDFYLPNHSIIIEVDGGYHNAEVDKPKEDELKKLFPRIILLRFTNQDALHDPRKVKTLIKLEISGRLSSFIFTNRPNKRKTLVRGDQKKAISMLKHRKVLTA